MEGDVNPDSIFEEVTLEAKYTDDWSKSHYNPDLNLGYPNNSVGDMIDQAKRYSDAFPGGVKWFTNSHELAETYAGIFKKAGIKNFDFTVVAATR